MKSIVSGETPPQSLMPARSSSSSEVGDRFGGACRFIAGPSTSRASAVVPAMSSSLGIGQSLIAVPGFGWKFCTITSWT